MRRRLWLVDLALLAGIVFAGVELRQRLQDAQSREQALLRQTVRNAPAPTLPQLQKQPPSQAAQYLEVAQQLLFARDRNPAVVLEPPPAPPPPVPMPALPIAYGVMDLGSGPSIILSEKAGAPQKTYRAGEKVGEFTVTALNNREVVFEWSGKYLKKDIEDLLDKKPPAAPTQAAAPSTPQTPAAQPASTSIGTTSQSGPGVEMGSSSRACQAGDTTPPGTVQNGLRKVVTKTPFGESCRWEAVR